MPDENTAAPAATDAAPAPLNVGGDASAEMQADAAPVKDVITQELNDALMAVAKQFKAHIYGNAIETDSPKPYAFNCDGRE